MTQIVSKLTTPPSVINALVSGHRCQFKLLIWLKHAWKPTKWFSYESAPKTGFSNLYSKWYTYISDMDKNVRDHYAKPNKESFFFNLVSILGILYLLHFNKLVLGLINFKLSDFSELLKLWVLVTLCDCGDALSHLTVKKKLLQLGRTCSTDNQMSQCLTKLVLQFWF